MRLGITGAMCVTACAALGCGSDGSDGSGSAGGAQKRVRAVVQEALTTDDPGACTRLMTRGFLEQSTAERGRSAALRSCRADAHNVGAKELSINRVTVDGTSATANVSPRGGTLPFKDATFALRNERGRWKLHRLSGGTLDRPAFARVLRSQLAEEHISPQISGCAADDLAGVSDAAIVDAFVGPDSRALLVPVAVCTIRVGLTEQKLPSSLVDCITGGARRELTHGALGRKLAADPSSIGELQTGAGQRLGAKLAESCVRKLRLTRA